MLSEKKCVPCEGGVAPLTDGEEDSLLLEVAGWSVVRDGVHKLRKEFMFGSFMDAITFVNDVAKIAEGEGHHPDIYVYFKKVELVFYTHAIKGLSENDFIVAAKVDEVTKIYE
jgi:4a-hydroxytetrahydrobiopterin dehydratase